MNYDTSQMRVGDGSWSEVPLGLRGEYLLRLDEGLDGDPDGNHILFDYITEDSFETQYTDDNANYLSLEEYLSTTGRVPPEVALQACEESSTSEAG